MEEGGGAEEKGRRGDKLGGGIKGGEEDEGGNGNDKGGAEEGWEEMATSWIREEEGGSGRTQEGGS